LRTSAGVTIGADQRVLAAAVTASSVGFNISRAVGPALGGVIIGGLSGSMR
jgi:hypothetical protein